MRALESYGHRLLPGLRKSLAEQRGALVLCDSFTSSTPQEPPHGVLVAQVAQLNGFRGKVVAVPFEDPADADQQERAQQLYTHVQAWGEAHEPAVVRNNLYESILATRLGALHSATQRVLALSEAGARNSVLNLSLGSTPALCVEAILHMSQDPAATSQLTRAFGGDWKPHLTQLASATSADKRLQAARAQFAEAVRNLEQGNNSVVVAAGNDGTLPQRLGCAVPEGFTRSDLVTPETTVVGALENGQPARYNGDPASIHFYAPGEVFLPQLGQAVHGTSFAAPQVAAAMARLHAQFPAATSAEVEALLAHPPTDSAH